MVKRKGRPQGVVVGKTESHGGAETVGSDSASKTVASTSTEVLAQPQAVLATTLSRKGKKRRRQSESGSKPLVAPERSDDTALVAATLREASAQEPLADADSAASPVGDCPRPPWTSGAGSAAGNAKAVAAIEWLLWPLTPAQFFAEYWEKKPLHVQRGRLAYYDGLFSKAELDRQLQKASAPIAYGDQLNIVRYDESSRKKEILNPGPRGTVAQIEDVARAWKEGASLQVMHPQQFHEPEWALLSSLEKAFGSLCGANAYLTPVGKQAFAPHYDDVEVFMLQLEGAKRWRLHAPPEGEEQPLPRECSRDFDPAELGEQLLECKLERGDLLYLPRGTVYAGVLEEQGGSSSATTGFKTDFNHHLTVSTYQQTSWYQVLEKALSGALERAASSRKELREGLPMNFLRYMGSWHDCDPNAIGQDTVTESVVDDRDGFKRKVTSMLRTIEEFIDVDEVCDEIGVDFTARRLPPCRKEDHEQVTAASSEITLDVRARWVDPCAVRPMITEDPETSEPTVILFHCLENDRRQHMNKAEDPEEDVSCLRYEAATFMPALRKLWAAGDRFVCCKDLPLAREEDRIALFEDLHKARLLEIAPGGDA